jgi:hypothetical protein
MCCLFSAYGTSHGTVIDECEGGGGMMIIRRKSMKLWDEAYCKAISSTTGLAWSGRGLSCGIRGGKWAHNRQSCDIVVSKFHCHKRITIVMNVPRDN